MAGVRHARTALVAVACVLRHHNIIACACVPQLEPVGSRAGGGRLVRAPLGYARGVTWATFTPGSTMLHPKSCHVCTCVHSCLLAGIMQCIWTRCARMCASAASPRVLCARGVCRAGGRQLPAASSPGPAQPPLKPPCHSSRRMGGPATTHGRRAVQGAALGGPRLSACLLVCSGAVWAALRQTVDSSALAQACMRPLQHHPWACCAYECRQKFDALHECAGLRDAAARRVKVMRRGVAYITCKRPLCHLQQPFRVPQGVVHAKQLRHDTDA